MKQPRVEVELRIEPDHVLISSRFGRWQTASMWWQPILAVLPIPFVIGLPAWQQEGPRFAVLMTAGTMLLLMLIYYYAYRTDVMFCTREFLEISHKRPFFPWRRKRFATKDVQEMQFATLRITLLGIVYGLIFRVHGKKYANGSHLTPIDAGPVLRNSRSLAQVSSSTRQRPWCWRCGRVIRGARG